MDTETKSFISDAQAKIRAIAAKYPDRGAALTDASNYRISRSRRMIDEGEYGTCFDVHFSWPRESGLGGGCPVGIMDSERDARALIEGRCSALK